MLANAAALLALSGLAFAAPARRAVNLASSTSNYAHLSAQGFTNDKWIQAYEKAVAYVAGMSLEQKVRRESPLARRRRELLSDLPLSCAQINFTDFQALTNGCSGLGFPLADIGLTEGICTADGPSGASSLALLARARTSRSRFTFSLQASTRATALSFRPR